MNTNINDPFLRMAFYGILGAVIGVFAGFAIALLIQALDSLALRGHYSEFRDIIPFLGMGFGAVIGALLGGVVGLRRKE
jgi:hypothetical protein